VVSPNTINAALEVLYVIELSESHSLPIARLVCFSIILSLVSSTSAPTMCSVAVLLLIPCISFSFLICWGLVLKCYELRTRQHKKC
jgi:hypothetical protein